MKTQQEIDRIKSDLDKKLNGAEVIAGNIDILIQYALLQLGESIGALSLYGASEDFIRKVVEESLSGARIGSALRASVYP